MHHFVTKMYIVRYGTGALWDIGLVHCGIVDLARTGKKSDEFQHYCSHSRGVFTNVDYSQVSDIRRTLVGNKIVDHSDVVGASPVGAAPTTSSFST